MYLILKSRMLLCDIERHYKNDTSNTSLSHVSEMNSLFNAIMYMTICILRLTNDIHFVTYFTGSESE